MRQQTQQAVNNVAIKPIRWILGQVIGAIDIIADEFYDHFDLWADKENQIPDYNKVRGFVILYAVVCPVIWYVVITAKTIPTTFLMTMLLGLMSLAVGERMFGKFLFFWGKRGANGNGSSEVIEMSPKEILYKIDPDIRPPSEIDKNEL